MDGRKQDASGLGDMRQSARFRYVQLGVRVFSHVIVGADDLEAARTFYDAVLAPLGLRQRAVMPDGGPPALCWIHPLHPMLRFYAYRPFNRQPANVGNGSMVAFLAPSQRDHYGVGSYGACLRDPSGNKIHLAYRGDIPGFGQGAQDRHF